MSQTEQSNQDCLGKNMIRKIEHLEQRIQYLEKTLQMAGIAYDSDPWNVVMPSQCTTSVRSEKITRTHINLFYSMFKGRRDVYVKRGGKPNPKTGKTGYYTQCWNFWKDGICSKRTGKKVKCSECANQSYRTLMGKDLLAHLEGKRENCSDVIGIYPMFPNETCYFLVFDFDNHDDKNNEDDFANIDSTWIEEVNAMREICHINNVDALVERSRSGKGAHVWIFFAEAIPASVARSFGSALLTKGAEAVNQKSFSSYDRMIPAQNHLPEGGLGNLIALPLQGQALQHGNSAFIDENWQVYPDQWQILRTTKKLSKDYVEEKVREWSKNGILGILSEDLSAEKPWTKKEIEFNSLEIRGTFQFITANQIFIQTDNLNVQIQNKLRRLAAYSNPEFYRNQAMGFSTRGIPRIVSCSHDEANYICLPRGCEEKLIKKLKSADIPYKKIDCRQQGHKINVSFNGQLYPEQNIAAETMLAFDIGILGAATAFGKTAVGAYLIAYRKVNTLILVQNTEIMNNWIEDLEKFLKIDEKLPEYQTPTGRVKKRKSIIGQLCAKHNSISNIIDVAMIPSLGKNDEINPLVKNYGMIIMDECHHGASSTAMGVLREVNAKYVYGLTATPKRDDGQEQKIFMYLGPIRYRYTAKDRARQQQIAHYIIPRFTRLIDVNAKSMKINDAYKAVRTSEIRNQQIINDVTMCLKNGRTPLVLTKFKDHAAYLYEHLKNAADHVFLLQGGVSTKRQDLLRKEMKLVPAEESIILVAIGQYIGEGFNYPRLDTMMLTIPIAWQGNVEQYAGRLHRDYDGKNEVVIYDYVDSHIRVLEKMYHKRLRAYKKMGYDLRSTDKILQPYQKTNAIFDKTSYMEIYENDVLSAQQEIIISSPRISTRKILKIIQLLKGVQERGVKITIATLQSCEWPSSQREKVDCQIRTLINSGIDVKLFSHMHEHYAIFDKHIVWYGSMNLLSNEKEDDSMMRLDSKEIAQELMKVTFGTTSK